jgi:Ca2+-binding RTX toxin-like protein
MSFVAVAARLKITGFTEAQEDSIWADLETAYVGSATARKMLDDWIAVPGNTIDIKYVPGVYRAYTKDVGGGVHVGTGELEIDPADIVDLSYISEHGLAIEHSQIGALMHELGHALTGRQDNYDIAAGYFMGDNVKFVNTIWDELGLTLELSYVGQSYDIGSAEPDSFHRTGYEYTNGATIEGAISSDKALVATGKTSDLLIGGPSRNSLQSGPGNDFLVGEGGNDVLSGGPGTDTAVLFGDPVDYDIRRDLGPYNSWTARHVRGKANEGIDAFVNMEKVQFGAQTYDLKAGGLTFQTDLAFVVDTTGSMKESIGSVKAQATALIDALFAAGKTDARIGVVSFKDWEYGDPTKVVLPFTDHVDFATRRSAAVSAINSLTADGGGPDVAETAFDGLWAAVNGDMGEWRVGAGVHRIVLFTDAPPKDQSRAAAVKEWADNVGGVVVESGSVLTGAGGSLATFKLALPGGESSGADLALPDDGEPLPDFEPRDEPVEPDPTLSTIEIYTIFTSPRAVDTQAFESLSHDTGGAFLTAASGGDVATVLLDIIGGLDLVGTPEVDALTGGVHIDKLTGLDGNDSLDGGGNADTMVGGTGDDGYAVDHPKDSVFELPGEGTDGVATTLTFYVLPDEVENGTAAGGAGAVLTANDLANLLTGGAAGDVLIGLGGDDRLQGSAGADLLFGGRPSPGQGPGQLALDVGTGNDSIGSAIDLSNLLSLAADPDILDATTVPHVSITGKGYGTLHYFAIGLEAGDVLTLDIDRGKGANNFLSVVAGDASVLASGNDSATSQGAGGSTSTLDAFVQYTAATAGVHYIVVGRVTTKTGDPNVGEQWASILQPGDSYELQVSVDTAAPSVSAAPAGAFASGADTLAGGLGADLLLGGDGVDSFEGTLAELDGDSVGDYQAGEKIVVQGVVSSDVSVSWSKSSKVVGIDVTGDGIAEASVTLDVAPDDLIASGLQLAVLPAGDGTDTSIAFTTLPAGPVVSVAAQAADRMEGDAATAPFTFAVVLSQASLTAETVSWSVAGRGGTPAGAADFAGGVLPSGIVTFAAGETSQVVTVDVLGDTVAEADEGFSLFLSDASAGLAVGAAVATGTIVDDDGAVVAHDDAYISLEGQALAAALPSGLLANDEHASTASLVSGPAHGTLQLVGDGTFTYTPAAGFSGIDTFTYQAGNSGSTMGEAEVAIHVVPVQVGASTTLDLLGLTAEEQIAATYAVFFGRGADLLGFDFWVAEFVQGLPAQGPATLFANIASSFGISDEAKGLYPFLADPFGASDAEITAFLESVYDNLFDRASDAAGLAYWTDQITTTLAAGQFVGSVLVNIMSGAQDTAAGQDITTLMGKVAVSLAYVREQEERATSRRRRRCSRR